LPQRVLQRGEPVVLPDVADHEQGLPQSVIRSSLRSVFSCGRGMWMLVLFSTLALCGDTVEVRT
jgi:hypothetical protein